MRILLSGFFLLAGLGYVEAQTAAGTTATAARAARPSLAIQVTEGLGKTIPDVAVRLTGTIAREGKTDGSGQITFTNLRAGSFRLRFERDGFVTLERDVTLRTTPPFPPVDVTLTAAPPPPAVEPPPPPAPAPAATRPGVGESKTTSVPTFVERNFIGRSEGKKESNVACLGTATAVIIQLRDPLPQHIHADADEMLYIVAGEATLKIDGREDPVDAGSFSSIPANVAHTLTRRGRNPVIILSMLTGAPCDAAATK